MRAFRVLVSLFFLVYLAPGPLLHELIDHKDSCELHAFPSGSDQICPEHHHCELCHFEGPSYFEAVSNHGFAEELEDQRTEAICTEDHAGPIPGTLASRGPPVNYKG